MSWRRLETRGGALERGGCGDTEPKARAGIHYVDRLQPPLDQQTELEIRPLCKFGSGLGQGLGHERAGAAQARDRQANLRRHDGGGAFENQDGGAGDSLAYLPRRPGYLRVSGPLQLMSQHGREQGKRGGGSRAGLEVPDAGEPVLEGTGATPY
jgi:hypothetical protein